MKLNNLKKPFLVYLAAHLIILSATAQIKDVTVASPTAASLGKYVDIPVNYHTGVPEISIPIHTVQVGSLKLPISLSYHASGLKVMEQASWVGAGWTLNAGGVIMRTPKGYFDELAKVDKSYLGDKSYYNYIYYQEGGLDYLDFANGNRDGEPDLFFYNFNGYSGKFYFRPDGSTFQVPEGYLKIVPKFCDTCTGRLSGFEITTPEGTKYFFGEDPTLGVSAIERTDSYSLSGGASFIHAISSWYLYKIESPDQKNKIKLNYVSDEYAFYNIATFPVPNSYSGGIDLVKQRIYGVRLSGITTETNNIDNGTSITFSVDAANPRQDLSNILGTPTALHDKDNTTSAPLKQIQITDGSLCKQFDFTTAYFVDNVNSIPSAATFGQSNTGLEGVYSLHTDKKRLKLVSVQEKSCNSSIAIPPYKFTYYDETSVPRTLSLGVDHWGYANGANSNAHLIPSVSADGGHTLTDGYNANRDSSWPQMRAGTLKSIRYPTGGSVEYEYKNHSAWVERPYFPSVEWSETKSETMYRTSTKYSFQLTSSAYFEISVSYPNGGIGGGSAYIDKKSSSGTVLSRTPYFGDHKFQLQAGYYDFYVISSYNSSYNPVEAVLTKYTPLVATYMAEVPVGGLRIETIKQYDAINTTPITTTFSYVDANGTSQGVLYSKPYYIALAKNDRDRESGVPGGFTGSGGDDRYRMEPYKDGCRRFDEASNILCYFFSAGSIHPMATSQGSHFGYNRVWVTQGDGGYTVYKYTMGANSGDVCFKQIDASTCDPFAPNFPPAPAQPNYYRGLLRQVQHFNAAGVLLSESFIDPIYTTNNEGITGFIVNRHQTDLLATEYEIKTAKKTYEKKVDLVYDPNNANALPKGSIQETYFESSYHNLPTRSVVSEVIAWDKISKIATKGGVLQETKNKYVADIVLPSCYPTYTPYTNLATSLSNAYSTYQSGVSACGSNLSCQFVRWEEYILACNNARINYVTARKQWFLTNGEACESNSTKYSAASTDLKAILDLKSMNQIDQVVESSQWRNGLLLKSDFTNFQMFDNNRKFIFPAKFESIRTPTPIASTSFTELSASNTGLVRDTRYVVEDNYTFKNGNIAEINRKNGILTSYKWGYNDLFPVAAVVNAKENQIYFEGFETSGTSGAAKTGLRYLNSGTYTIPFTPPADGLTYKMSYWYWANSKWNFSGELPFAVSISQGTQLDEIRVYPQGAKMATYSYQVGKGLVSMTDPNNSSKFFSYDDLGRSTVVKDDEGNIEVNRTYNYQIPTTNNN
jgi:hypothetical protein